MVKLQNRLNHSIIERIDYYQKNRPSYPQEILSILKNRYGVHESQYVADVACGSGLFSKLMLKNHFEVIGVEPDEQMRDRAIQRLGKYEHFQLIEGTAASTGLPDNCVDMITVAQAFHWFDTPQTVKEFCRILKPGGLILLLWNERKTDHDLFHQEYESLLWDYAVDYDRSLHRSYPMDRIKHLFPSFSLRCHKLRNSQEMNLQSLMGRLESAHYCPPLEHPSYLPLMEGVKELYQSYKENGKIRLEHQCKIYFLHQEN